MFDFLISPKVYAVSCTLNGLQLTAEKLYLKEPFAKPETINLYNDELQLVASVLIPQTDIQVHSNINLTLCPQVV